MPSDFTDILRNIDPRRNFTSYFGLTFQYLLLPTVIRVKLTDCQEDNLVVRWKRAAICNKDKVISQCDEDFCCCRVVSFGFGISISCKTLETSQLWTICVICSGRYRRWLPRRQTPRRVPPVHLTVLDHTMPGWTIRASGNGRSAGTFPAWKPTRIGPWNSTRRPTGTATTTSCGVRRLRLKSCCNEHYSDFTLSLELQPVTRALQHCTFSHIA